MKHLYPLVLGTALSAFNFSVQAESAPPASSPLEINALIHAKAEQSGKGVILALSQRGNQAVETAYLLSNQAPINQRYTPLLLVSEPEKLQQYLSSLNLTAKQLPALIFFDSAGRELSRVVAAVPNPNSRLVNNIIPNSP